MSFFRVASISLLFASACIDELPTTSEVGQQLGLPKPPGCDDEFGCGTNSPEVDNLGVHDIHGKVGGAANANGFRVIAITLAGAPYKYIYSTGGMLSITDGTTTLTGAPVVGTIITVANGTNTYDIQIQELGRTPYWAHVAGNEVSPTYKIAWDVTLSAPGQKRNWRNICKKPVAQNSPELRGMDAYSTVVFELDEINAQKKTITKRTTPVGETRFWFNIGCAGHALAKLHLTGHTTGAATAYPNFQTSYSQRQATLKMFAADYCGTGYAFTVAGQPLQWRDATPINVYLPGFAGKKEAQWTEKGARCLNKPRVLANPTPLGSSSFPNLLDDIKFECDGMPPACASADPYDLGGDYIISSNP